MYMMEKLTNLFLCLFLAGTGWVNAQTTQVTGVVTSAEDGEPVIGATVMVKGASTGTVTDFDGKFSLSAPASATTLTVSFVGMMTQEVKIAPNLRISLSPSAEMLDEVMVVAYGTAKKSSFTGAASQVSGEKIRKMQVSNVSKSLEGSVAGVQTSSSSGTPGSSANILIRGIGSVSASQSPLIVVDGVPYEGSLNSISTHDIESMTVLKDAAANSMYGARGSNGVIIITTKGGKSGKTTINFEGRFGFNQRGVPNYNIISDAGEYYEMLFESVRNNLLSEMSLMEANVYAANNLIGGYAKYNVFKGVADNQLIDPLTERLNPAATQKKWNDSWQTDPFETGARQEYTFNISGGTEATTAYASLAYLSDAGYFVNSGFDRVSARAKVDHKFKENFKVMANVSYSNTSQQTFGGTDSNYSNIFMFSQQIAPIYPIYLYENDGSPVYDADGGREYDWGTEHARPYAAQQNPYAAAKYGNNHILYDNISSRGSLEYKFLKDFTLTANLAYDVFVYNATWFATPKGGDAKDVGGRGEKENARTSALNANQLLNWTHDFSRHNVSILLGHENKLDKGSLLYGHMTNFVDADNSDFANATLYQELTSYALEYAIEGYFGRAEYNYADKYYASASFRRDGSSKFHPDVRWGSFWSAGASWRVKEESFLRDVEAVSTLKLKASYGTQGNDNLLMPGGAAVIKAYSDLYRIDRVSGEAGMTKVFRGNPDLTWEKSRNFNAGFESRFFDRLSLEADFFIKETKDLLFQHPLSPSEGNPNWIYRNDVDMKNTGVEFNLDADIVKTNDVRWNVAFNGMHYRNELTRLPSSKDPVNFPGGYQAGSYWRKLGGSLYDWYTYEFAGVDPENGLPLYNKYKKDANGTETFEKTVNTTAEASLRQTGKSAIPRFSGGFATTLEVFGFDLSAATAFQLGGYVMDSYYRVLMGTGEGGENMHKDMFNRWTPTHTATDIPQVIYSSQDANQPSNRFLTSSSYFSLRNVTLGYALPSAWLRKADISRLRLYVTGDNIVLFTQRKGLDPRQNFDGGTGYVYSALSTYSLGLSLSF
jgi:TonB-linked SusC/RagA family outer membrane protein